MQDIIDGKIPPEMKPSEAKATRPEYLKMDATLFSSRLAGLRKSATRPEKKKKPAPWNKKKPVRELMKREVVDGDISRTMDFKTAWELHAVYKEMNFDLFKSRLTSMREIVKKAFDRANEDAMDLFKDREKHPVEFTNLNGNPEWHLHDAKTLLEIDMDEGKHKAMEPRDLWLTRLHNIKRLHWKYSEATSTKKSTQGSGKINGWMVKKNTLLFPSLAIN